MLEEDQQEHGWTRVWGRRVSSMDVSSGLRLGPGLGDGGVSGVSLVRRQPTCPWTEHLVWLRRTRFETYESRVGCRNLGQLAALARTAHVCSDEPQLCS